MQVHLPAFSRAQLGITLLVAAVLLGFYVARGPFLQTSETPGVSLPAPVFVEVTGQVPRPGVHAFPSPPTLAEVCRRAGAVPPALSPEARLISGTLVHITEAGSPQLSRMSGERLRTLGVGLDLNTAGAQDLEALPGIGPALARRLVEYRQTHGPFKTVEDLLKVPGIGRKKLDQLKPFLLLDTLDNQGSSEPPP